MFSVLPVNQDTIAAIATPPGEGGIAVLRVSGPDALAIAGRIFLPQKGDVPDFPGYSVHYGRFADAATGEIADDGLLTVFRAPHSYTGEDITEFSCHGGRATTARVLQIVLAAGARMAEPGEFTQRAFLNGKLDLAQAEAVADVIRARTESARRLARRQLDGDLSRSVKTIRDELIGILAAIEVTLDFSDEVGDLQYDLLLRRIRTARRYVEELLETSQRGRILREGLRIAIVGRPNVGKSSLLNALLRADRAIVTPIAGTTRDVLEESASIGGVPVVLVDTAGIRETEDVIERLGVERAENALEASDLILFVLDATAGYTSEDAAIAAKLVSENAPKVLLVWNKSDLVSDRIQTEKYPFPQEMTFQPAAMLRVSAQTGKNLNQLEAAILNAAGNSDFTDSDSVVIASVRHQNALQTAAAGLHEAEQTTRQELPGDFIAIDVRGALDALGLITGETVTDDIIHRIFRDFCVGK